MNSLRLITATLATGLSMWLAGGIWHEVLAAHFYTEGIEQDHQGIGLILIAYLILAALMVSLYVRLFPTGTTKVRTVIFGATIGVLWVFPHTLSLAATHGRPLLYVFQNASWHLVEQGIGALALGGCLQIFDRWRSVKQHENA